MRYIKFYFVFWIIFTECWSAFAAAPGFDSSGAAKGTFHGSNSGSFNVTTTSGNVLLLLGIVAERTIGQGSSASVSTVAGGSLIWANRSQIQSAWGGSTCVAGAGNPCYGDTELWWACSSSSLSTTSVTVTFAQTIDNAVMVLLPVTGVCPTATPFDTNISLPGTASNTVSTTSTVGVTVSTTENSDLLFLIAGYSNNQSQSDQTSGICRSYNETTTAGTGDTSIDFYAQQFSSPQTSLAFNFNNSASCTGTKTVHGWSAIVDAVTNGVPSNKNVLMFKSGPGW